MARELRSQPRPSTAGSAGVCAKPGGSCWARRRSEASASRHVLVVVLVALECCESPPAERADAECGEPDRGGWQLRGRASFFGRYADALLVCRRFCEDNAALAVGGLSCRAFAAALPA